MKETQHFFIKYRNTYSVSYNGVIYNGVFKLARLVNFIMSFMR